MDCDSEGTWTGSRGTWNAENSHLGRSDDMGTRGKKGLVDDLKTYDICAEGCASA